jgi:hypothetical protein
MIQSTTTTRPAPFLFERHPRSRTARRAAEGAWSLYPPLALLAAVLLAAGCKSSSDDSGSTASRPTQPPVAETATSASAQEISYPGYPIETPLVGVADARATVNYGRDRLMIANLSDQPWPATRVWVNHRYGALLPHTHPGQLRTIHFGFLRDEQGRPFPKDNMAVRIESVELVTDDERTTVTFALGY